MPKMTSAQREGLCPCGSGLKVKDCCKGKPKKQPTDADKVNEVLHLIECGELVKARAQIEALIATGTPIADAHIALVFIELQEAQFAVAEAKLRAVLTTIAPGNAHAAGLLAQLLIMRGQRAEATAIVDDLMAQALVQGHEVLGLVSALNLLERDSDVVIAAGRIADRGVGDIGTFHYAAGVAHFNLGKVVQARALLRKAVHMDGGEAGDVRRMLDVVHGAPLRAPWPRLEVLSLADLAPGSSAMALLQLASEGRFVNDEHGSVVIARIVRAALVYAPALDFVDAVLTALAKLHPAVALPELRTIWQSAMLNDEGRQHAVRLAHAASLIKEDTSISVFIDGALTTSTYAKLERDAGPDTVRLATLQAMFELPEGQDALLRQALELQEEGDDEAAIAMLQQLAASRPDDPVVTMHLVVLRHASAVINDVTAVAGLRAVVAVAPRLLMVRELLARMLMAQDRHDEADVVITAAQLDDALDDRQLGVVHSAIARAAQRGRDHEAARDHAVLALTYLGIAGLEHSAKDVLRLAAFELDERRALIEMPEIEQRLERRVDVNAPTRAWYAHLQQPEFEDVMLMIKGLAAADAAKARKSRQTSAVLLTQLVTAIEQGDVVRHTAEGVPGAAKLIVEVLVANNGRLPWEQALRLNLENDAAWDDEFAFSPLGIVLGSGLAVVANVDGAAVAVMPPVVLTALRERRS